MTARCSGSRAEKKAASAGSGLAERPWLCFVWRMIETVSDDLTLTRLRSGGKPALARALAYLERAPESPGVLALLAEAETAALGQTLGLTGPPGVGKSTLTGALIGAYREAGLTVGVIAVDPSSKRSGGALLGDRVRLASNGGDAGLFIRSMAARDRLGGLADQTVAAMVLMRALFDRVLIETVGVGQSETDVAGVVDTVVFCVQPGSGDSLQFMKAGIVEVPHLAVVTKADTGPPARRALADLRGALGLSEAEDGWTVEARAVSAETREGLPELIAALERHHAWLTETDRLTRRRRAQAEGWLVEALRERFGTAGLKAAGDLTLPPGASSFTRLAELGQALTTRLGLG
ncbi:ArgK/MeaB family GTPase [Algihabitans albus]|uniref:ArgK/MeaB family GTPase n=1 Tax=Algihabitans albus TaxID=2164067 RepID=UPI002E26C929